MLAPALPQSVRMFPAVLLAMFSLIFLTAPPAQAATAPTSPAKNYYSGDGVLVTWSDDSFTDLAIRPTNSRKITYSSSEAAYVGAEIAEAWQTTRTAPVGRAASSNLYAMAAATNGCSFSPDSWGRADFKPTCDEHDICYSSPSTVPRLTCDNVFRDRLRQVCVNAYGPTGFQSSACRGVAATYYQAVRTAGRSFYDGQGDPS